MVHPPLFLGWSLPPPLPSPQPLFLPSALAASPPPPQGPLGSSSTPLRHSFHTEGRDTNESPAALHNGDKNAGLQQRAHPPNCVFLVLLGGAYG
jgi:hypothetical protein